MSVDGKITTADDFDRDLKDFPGIEQYYELEQETFVVSLITGKTLAKMGYNDKSVVIIKKLPVTLVVVDNKPHLTARGVEAVSTRYERVIVVTTDISHPAYKSEKVNVETRHFYNKIDLARVVNAFRDITIQSGGELNSGLFALGLIDTVTIVMAPIVVGGRETATLVDGEILPKYVKLELISCETLKNSFIKLDYAVIKNG
jgi:2,5-diamino-6-(ribosylamino)-4(3H)-pyrimidinone 5'-phosphate reductase